MIPGSRGGPARPLRAAALAFVIGAIPFVLAAPALAVARPIAGSAPKATARTAPAAGGLACVPRALRYWRVMVHARTPRCDGLVGRISSGAHAGRGRSTGRPGPKASSPGRATSAASSPGDATSGAFSPGGATSTARSATTASGGGTAGGLGPHPAAAAMHGTGAVALVTSLDATTLSTPWLVGGGLAAVGVLMGVLRAAVLARRRPVATR